MGSRGRRRGKEAMREPLYEKWINQSSPATGSKTYFTEGVSKYAMQVISMSGTAPTWNVRMQGSINGSNWSDLITTVQTDPLDAKTIVDKPMLAVRMILASVTGSPTIECFGLVDT